MHDATLGPSLMYQLCEAAECILLTMRDLSMPKVEFALYKAKFIEW